ncbi:trans-2-enoyl-CoA reductase [Gracilaria domingensis]|nr:trans-2-enoyl-CoA reductase [Gracilaria domingensis]
MRHVRALSTAYTFTATGPPSSVLSREQLPTPKPSDGHLRLKWLAAGVDPVDLATLAGSPSASEFAPSIFPAVAGNEGVARVTATGAGKLCYVRAQALFVHGANFLRAKTSLGTWRESSVIDSAHVIPVPRNIRVELAATLSASPFTAYRLLRDFVNLQPGDVVLQNAASSPVGSAIVQLAKSMGLETVSLVNTPSADYAPTVERLKLMGGDVVIGDQYITTEGFYQVMSDMPKPSLVINGADEASCATLAAIAPKGTTMVTYCPGEANPKALRSKGLKNASFSLPEWLEQTDRAQIESMVIDLTNMIESGELTAWLQRVKFDQLPAAIQQGGMINRKLVAVME